MALAYSRDRWQKTVIPTGAGRRFFFWFVRERVDGLRVLEIVSPWDDPAHFSGFSPRPVPKLIATARTRGPALAVSKGIDRDRAVDESGNQLAVFGRRGARPLNSAESRLLLSPRQLWGSLYRQG